MSTKHSERSANRQDSRHVKFTSSEHPPTETDGFLKSTVDSSETSPIKNAHHQPPSVKPRPPSSSSPTAASFLLRLTLKFHWQTHAHTHARRLELVTRPGSLIFQALLCLKFNVGPAAARTNEEMERAVLGALLQVLQMQK